MNRQRRDRRGGFTLIEIMVVVVIIGILASFLVVNYYQSGERMKVDLTRSKIADLGSTLESYKLEFSRLPATLQELIPKFLNEMPRDAWNRDFIYQRDPQALKGYRLMSYGADGNPGGLEENADLSNQDAQRPPTPPQ